MLRGKWKKSAMPIGLDVGSHGVRLLQLAAKSSGSYAAIAAAAERLPAGLAIDSPRYHEEVAQAIGKALGRGAFVGRKVVSVLPASAMHFKNLRLPKMPRQEIASAVAWEARDRLNFGNSKAATQFVEAGEVHQGEDIRQEVILMASSRDFIEAHVGSLIEHHLEPITIDAIPTAIARVFASPEGQASDQATVVIDLGYACSKVLILRGGRVVFFKIIEVGGATINQAIGDSLNLAESETADLRENLRRLDPAEDSKDPVVNEMIAAVRPAIAELGREIALCLRYYGVTFRGPRPAQASVVGGGSGEPWLIHMLAESTGIRLDQPCPVSQIDFGTLQSTLAPDERDARRWALAAGLSLRADKRALFMETDRGGIDASQTEGVAA